MTPRDWCIVAGLLAGVLTAVWMWTRPPRCPACGSKEIDNLGDGESAICLRCDYVWIP